MTEPKTLEPPQLPAGPLVAGDTYTEGDRDVWIAGIEQAPARLREAVSGLTDEQLDTTYRNWTIRQIVHHIADSHLNGYLRFRLALTEERPTINPYDESRWAVLDDARRAGIEASLQIFEGLHARWAYLLRSLPHDVFERAFYHPESQEVVPLWRALALYAWHGRHHTAQIEWVRKHKLSVS